MEGTIKTLKTGFGFIRSTEGPEYFFHHTGLVDVFFNELMEGNKVMFDVDEKNGKGKGPRACNVRLIS